MAEIIGGKAICILCKEAKPATEMHSPEVCQHCYEAKMARNAGKPKPKKITRPKQLNRIDANYSKMLAEAGIIVPDTERKPLDNGFEKSEASDGLRVPGTVKKLLAVDFKNIESADGSPIIGTLEPSTDNDGGKSNAANGSIVPEPLARIESLEKTVLEQAELIALALRRIKILEGKGASADSSIVPETGANGLEKLRDDLHTILKDRYERTKTNGIYVHSLYGPNGRVGGKLKISKVQAYRLRDACRLDTRFKVEKAENVKGNWIIKLNLFIQ